MAEGTTTGWGDSWRHGWLVTMMVGALTLATLAWGEQSGRAAALASGHLWPTPRPATGPSRPGPLANTPADRVPEPPMMIVEEQRGLRRDSIPLSGEVDVLVELIDPPAARVYAVAREILGVPETTARELQHRQQQQLEARQQALVQWLTGPEINAVVIGQTQTVLNAVLIRVDAVHIERIRQLPGVSAVRLLRVGEWHVADETLPERDPEAPARPIAPAVPIGPDTPAIQ